METDESAHDNVATVLNHLQPRSRSLNLDLSRIEVVVQAEGRDHVRHFITDTALRV